MLKEITPEKVYGELATKGFYEEAHLDKDEVEKVIALALEDYEFGKNLRTVKKPSWRVIFNIHYDVFRELCDQLMRFERQKTSNHRGLFAFIVLHFPKLELDWKFLESIRTVRNRSKYEGLDISKEMWKGAEFQMDLYISTIRTEVEKRLKGIT